MRLLTILGSKGGIGKSTLASGLLVAALRARVDAVGLDLDEQRTFARWAAKRADERREPPARVAVGSLKTWRQDISAGAQLLVVDTPPGMPGADLNDLGAAADLVLIPAPPYELVLEAVGELGKALGATFVLNMVDRSPEVADARAYLARLSDVCPVEIPSRVDIRRETGAGGSVIERPRAAGAPEMSALWDYVAIRLGLG